MRCESSKVVSSFTNRGFKVARRVIDTVAAVGKSRSQNVDVGEGGHHPRRIGARYAPFRRNEMNCADLVAHARVRQFFKFDEDFPNPRVCRDAFD